MNYPEAPGMALPFERCSNFRELGGYRGAGGRRVRHGLFFRGPALAELTSARDIALYRKLKIKTIFDLRSSEDRKAYPDPLMEGVETIVGVSVPRSVSGQWMAVGDSAGGGEAAYRQIVLAAARGKLPMLIHGVTGRGPTGLACILLLKMLGVSDEDAVRDYLLSNRYCVPRGGLPADPERQAKVETAENFLRSIRARYSSFEIFLDRACGIGAEELRCVRETCLEQRSV